MSGESYPGHDSHKALGQEFREPGGGDNVTDASADDSVDQLDDSRSVVVHREEVALGVGHLSQAIGGQAALEFFEDRENRRRALYGRAILRYGVVTANRVGTYRRRVGSASALRR